MNKLIPLVTILLLACNQDQQEPRHRLLEIRGTEKSLNGLEGASPDSISFSLILRQPTSPFGITSDILQARCELRLRETTRQPAPCKNECLHIVVSIDRAFCNISLEFRRAVLIKGIPIDSSGVQKITYYDLSQIATWQSHGYIEHGRSPEKVMHLLDTQLDNFLNEYFKVNKRRIPGW